MTKDLKAIQHNKKTVRNLFKIVYNQKFQTFFTGDRLLFFSFLFFKYFNLICETKFNFNSFAIPKGNKVTTTRLKTEGIQLKYPTIKNKLNLYKSLNYPAHKFLALCKASLNAVQYRKEGYTLIHSEKSTALYSTSNKTFGIIRINTGFTNINISLTTLDGKVVQWISGGADPTQSKRTRMSSRAVGNLMLRFFKNFKKKLGLRFIKVLFVGPSKRFRSKFFSMIKRRSRRLKFSIICKEEGFHRSFNGCRLSRKKR